MKRTAYATLVVALLAIPLLAEAALKPMGQAGWEFGGKRLDALVDGPAFSLQSGSGLAFDAGLISTLEVTSPHAFETQLTAGVRMASEGKESAEGTVTYWRYPLRMMSFYRNVPGQFRFGAGAEYLAGGTIRGTRERSASSTELARTWGFVATVEGLLGTDEKNLNGFGLTYSRQTIMARANGRSVPAESWGLQMTIQMK